MVRNVLYSRIKTGALNVLEELLGGRGIKSRGMRQLLLFELEIWILEIGPRGLGWGVGSVLFDAIVSLLNIERMSSWSNSRNRSNEEWNPQMQLRDSSKSTGFISIILSL